MCGWQTEPLLFLGYTQPTHLHSDSGSNTWYGSPLSMPICHACTVEASTLTWLHTRHCLFCFHSHHRFGTLLFDKKLSWIHDLNESTLVNSNSCISSVLTYCEGTFFFLFLFFLGHFEENTGAVVGVKAAETQQMNLWQSETVTKAKNMHLYSSFTCTYTHTSTCTAMYIDRNKTSID